MELPARLRQPDIQDVFRRHGLEAAFLFGSRAGGRAGPDSDVDLAVLFPRISDAKTRLDSVLDITRALRPLFPVPVDVVSVNDASPLLAFGSVIGGITVYAPDPDGVARSEIRVRHRYEDFLHIHEIWMKGFRERLEVR